MVCTAGFSQIPVSNDAFPTYHPNLDVPDVVENALPYYYLNPQYSYTYCTSSSSCQRATYQYAFGEGRTSEDGRSDFDIYYSDHWDQTLAPNGKPVVLLLPGGSGSRKSNTLVYRAITYAQRGYIAIVGDYRSARDSMFSECLTKRQGYFAIQTAVVDARAILRRAFYLSSLPESNFVINPEQIFLDGVTWGSLATYHMSIMDLEDYPTGTVSINDVEYSFTDDLDHLQICEDPDGLCNSYLPYPNYEIKDFIRGVAARNIYVLDLEMIDEEDSVPTIIVHGTCDEFSPFYMREARHSFYTHHMAYNGNAATAPCQEPEDFSFITYGGERMYRRLLELSGTDSPDIFMRYFRLCGEDHTLPDYSVRRTCLNVNCIQINMVEYETLRFFAEILNDLPKVNEVFNLDHTLRESPDEIAASICALFPGPDAPLDHPSGGFWPILEEVCPNCADGLPEVYDGLMRYPYFAATAGEDADRYPLVAECDILSANGHQLIGHAVSMVKVYDFMGNLILQKAVNGSDILRSFLQSGHGLKPGLYAVHYGDGFRKAVMVY